MSIIYRKGDVTIPQERGKIMIAHGCNDSGIAGAGVIIAIKNRYPIAIDLYKDWAVSGYYLVNKTKIPFRLGEFQAVKINDNLYVANLITQRHINNYKWLIPFRYESFAECLLRLNDFLLRNNFTHFVIPRIGCGLGGGNWTRVAKIIDKCISIPVTVYDNEIIDNTIYS